MSVPNSRSIDGVKLWLFDHGSDWASRVGDWVSRPFTRLESYCNRRWHEERRRG